jgi:phosphodiesterase/alkaline phosphatase D-like protein
MLHLLLLLCCASQNHNNSDGENPQLPWEERKTNAIRAYYEYMPIRQVR